MYMITCLTCGTSNPIDAPCCLGCGLPIPEVTAEHIAAIDPPRFKKFVKNDAPKGLCKLLLIDLIVCCVCLAISFVISFMSDYHGLADTIAMALTVLVMFLVKSRACAVILLVYSVLASAYGLLIDNSFACFPMIIAGILSTVAFLLLNSAYKKYKASLKNIPASEVI